MRERGLTAALLQSAAMRIWVARGLVFGMLALAGYGFWQGTSQDVVDAVRRGDVDGLKSALRKDPEAKVRDAALRAKAPGADDGAVNAYEGALDRWQRELIEAGNKKGTVTGTGAGITRPLGAPCDPNVGDPMCDASGHRI